MTWGAPGRSRGRDDAARRTVDFGRCTVPRTIGGCPYKGGQPMKTTAPQFPASRGRSLRVVGCRRQIEELLERLDLGVVHLGREVDADVAVVPRLELVPGDVGHALRVPQDEAPL